MLPALAWAAARLVPAGPLRDGVLAVGLAPCEIASVATTAMAGGEAAVAAGVLIGSTVAAVAARRPDPGPGGRPCRLLPGGVIAQPGARGGPPAGRRHRAARIGRAGSRASARNGRPAHRPLPAAGVGEEQAPTRISLRAWLSTTTRALATPRAQRIASHVALAAVAALVALIAAEVHFSAGYAAVAAALVVFLLASVVVGRLLGLRAPRPLAAALLLTTSMRDFAIAAGLAAAAFGPAAAAPLGLYGILVLVWGTAAAGALRR